MRLTSKSFSRKVPNAQQFGYRQERIYKLTSQENDEKKLANILNE